MRNKWLVILSFAVLLFVVSAAVHAQKVNISFWYPLGGSSGRVFQEFTDRFNATHPNIHVEAVFTGGYGETAQKIMASLAGGTLPDGGLIPAAPLFTGRSGNYLIEEYMNGPDGLDKNDFWPVLWEYNKYKGRICSLPFNNSTPVMFYNKDLLKSAGLPPEPPTTWAELKSMAVKIRDWAKASGKRNVWPINMRNEDWMLKAFILQNGGRLMNEDYSAALINQPESVEAIEFWLSLIEEELMPKDLHSQARKQFIAAQLAFLYDSTAGVGSIANTVKFDFGTAFLPGNKRKAVTVGGAALTMFPSTPEKQKATWTFLKWLLSPENCTEWTIKTGYIPVRKSILKAPKMEKLFANNPEYQAGFEQLEFATTMEHFWNLGTFDDYMRELISNVEFKKLTPKQAADKFVKDLGIEIERNP